MWNSVLRLVCQLSVVLLFLHNSACTVNPDDLPADTSAANIIKLAEQSNSRKQFNEAGDFFMEVDRLHPYSDGARKALVEAMKSYHDGTDLVNARLAAKRYLAIYPDGSDAPFAQYMIGLSFFDGIVDVQRDQGAALHSVREFQKLKEVYPDSDFEGLAKEKLKIAISQLAGQEMSVGRYYMRSNDYLAAINRFMLVLNNYSNTIFAVEASYRLTECYLALGMLEAAKQNDFLLRKKYPLSEWNLKSASLIKRFYK